MIKTKLEKSYKGDAGACNKAFSLKKKEKKENGSDLSNESNVCNIVQGPEHKNQT